MLRKWRHGAGFGPQLVQLICTGGGVLHCPAPHALSYCSDAVPATHTHTPPATLPQDYNQMDELRLESPRAGDAEQLQRSGSWLRRMFH